MSLILDDITVWLPHRGTILTADLTVDGGVTLLVGRNGGGASTLLGGIAGSLPAGALRRGTIRLDGHQIDTMTGAELSGSVRTVRSCSLDELRAHLARPGLRLALLDQVLATLDPRERDAACALVRRAADTGVLVLWAEHLLEDALPVADTVIEVLANGHLASSSAATWRPRTLPAPPLMALARGLGLPRADWLDGEVVRDHPSVRSALPGGRRPRRTAGDPLVVAAAAPARLDRDVELRHGECLGVVSTSGDRAREREVARRLVALARGDDHLAPLLTVPATTPVGTLVATWEERHRLSTGTVAQALEPLATLDPVRPLSHHSDGEAAALGWALSTTRPGPRLLVDPTDGLDPYARRHLATASYEDSATATVVVSRDLEFVVRACHRILVVDETQIVADGAPAAVLASLPAMPQLARIGAPVLRASDVLGAEVTV